MFFWRLELSIIKPLDTWGGWSCQQVFTFGFPISVAVVRQALLHWWVSDVRVAGG